MVLRQKLPSGSKGILESVKNGFETKASKNLTGITTDDDNANSGTKSGL